MAALLFHQNMRHFGGISRTSYFKDAFKEMRNANFKSDTVLAAGFTEITNNKSTKEALLQCTRALSGQRKIYDPIFYATGTTIKGDLSEYIAICVPNQMRIKIHGYGRTFLYVDDSDPKSVIPVTFCSENSEDMRILPPLNLKIKDKEIIDEDSNDIPTYSLPTNYRCIAFLNMSYRCESDEDLYNFTIGFCHNVFSSGASDLYINNMQKIFESISENIGHKNGPIIVGGDFNTNPHDILDRSLTGGVAINAFRKIGRKKYYNRMVDYDVETTNSSCIDYWYSNKNEIKRNDLYGDETCEVHTITREYVYKGQSTTLSDHAGISIKIFG